MSFQMKVLSGLHAAVIMFGQRVPVVVCTFFQASLPPRTSSTSFFFSCASLLICVYAGV